MDGEASRACNYWKITTNSSFFPFDKTVYSVIMIDTLIGTVVI